MRVAVIGSRMAAVFTADYFEKIGAEVVLFSENTLGDFERNRSELFPDDEISYNGGTINFKSFYNDILKPRIEALSLNVSIKSTKLLRIQKRFLHKNEKIKGHTRLHDLFRLVFSERPTMDFLNHLKENKSLRDSLGEEVVLSLENPIENFMDVDVVIDAREIDEMLKFPLGAGGSWAINEIPLQSSGMIFYGSHGYDLLLNPKIKKLILVGEPTEYKKVLLALQNWLFSDNERQIQVISFQSNKGHSEMEHSISLSFEKNWDSFLKKLEDDFNMKKEKYQNAIREWRDLEDFQKVKINRPEEPLEKVSFYLEYDVVSLDRLIDQKEIFATIECPDFRNECLSRLLPAMMTLKADAIWNLRKPLYELQFIQQNDPSQISLNSNEPGFYRLSSLNELQEIESDLMKYFKKRHQGE